MKKLLKTIMVCCLILPCLLFSACDFDFAGFMQNGQNNQNGNSSSGQNSIEDVTPKYNSITEASNGFTSNLTADQQNTTLPSFSANHTNTYAITEDGDYYYNTDSTTAITIAQSVENVHLYFEDVTFSVSKALISCADNSNTNVVITLKGTNSFENSAKNIINVTGNLTINGNGTLDIDATKSAISCDKTFYGLGGTLNIEAGNHCVSADSIYIDGTTINATSCGKDILHAESDYDEIETAPTFSYSKGFVFIEDGTITGTSVKGDGIQADSYVYIKDGTFNITTTPTWVSYTATSANETGLFDATNHTKVGKDRVVVGKTYAKLDESVKGIKVGEIDYTLASDTTTDLSVASDDYTILIEGGTFNIVTVDDAIHTNSGSALIYGGNITINTSDDGIHADTNLKIKGDSVINITNAYEGIEAQTIDISGGTTTIVALDDGVNASNGDLDENQQKSVCQLNISGGRLDVTVSPNGDKDGIDSNGGIQISGGIVITRGPNTQNASPLDAANAISLTGGVTIVIGNPPTQGGHFSGSKPGGTSFDYSDLVFSQTEVYGLDIGNHSINVGGTTTISYSNKYNYEGSVTIYATANASVD